MKNIIVREYLESLKEDRELDYIFPILLEVMGFKIITKPTETKGYQQYGKDVVAIGTDEDGVKKRFYFEIKGGADRHITTTNYKGDDGIRESILEAKDRPFRHSSDPEFKSLPVKIVLVHSGIIKENIRETFDGFIEQQFPANDKQLTARIPRALRKWLNKNVTITSYEFERWDIYKLTELFAEKLFNEYLLTDDQSVQLFKKVLLLFGTPKNDNQDFKILINRIFLRAGAYVDMSKRERLLLTETLKLISFIIHSYGKEAGNLQPVKQCLEYAILSYWKWILENNIDKDEIAIRNFKNYLATYRRLLDEYFQKTLPVAQLKKGLWSPKGGRYEQVGYPMRALSYLGALISYFEFINGIAMGDEIAITEQINLLNNVIINNDACYRPLLDIHSIPIIQTINFLLKNERKDDAVTFYRNTWSAIILGYRSFNRLPDGRNRVESVIHFMVTNKKNIYYEDKTSHLMGALLEYSVVLDLEDDYRKITDFLKEINVDLAVYVPYNDDVLKDLESVQADNHELALLDHTLNQEGYQSEISYQMDYDAFKNILLAKDEFSYKYRTVEAGFGFLIGLAHLFFETPIFPNSWREMKSTMTEA
jgi:hypothetical protein